MEGQRPLKPEITSKRKQLNFSINPVVIKALNEVDLPQRLEGGCSIQTWNPYRNLSDEQLPWTQGRLEEVMGITPDLSEEVLPGEVKDVLINLFGGIIVGLREGKSINIKIGTE